MVRQDDASARPLIRDLQFACESLASGEQGTPGMVLTIGRRRRRVSRGRRQALRAWSQ